MENRRRIINISPTNKHVNHMLHSWRSGNITFADAMVECVILLCEHNNNLENLLIDKMRNAPAPSIVMNTSRPASECNGEWPTGDTFRDENYLYDIGATACCDSCGLVQCECPCLSCGEHPDDCRCCGDCGREICVCDHMPSEPAVCMWCNNQLEDCVCDKPPF